MIDIFLILSVLLFDNLLSVIILIHVFHYQIVLFLKMDFRFLYIFGKNKFILLFLAEDRLFQKTVFS
jgi:hypothetical protein